MTELTRKKRQRSANKTAVKKLLEQTQSEMSEFTAMDEGKLTALRSKKDLIQAKILLVKQQELEILDLIEEDHIEEEINNNLEFELYANTEILKLNDFLLKCKQESQGSAGNKDSSTVKLPKLEIKKFEGDATKWQTFLESFESAVHSSKHLSDVEKFNYLKSYLQGAAAKTIEGISLSNENYGKALDALKARYGNKQVIISSHMQHLLNIKSVTSMSDIKGMRTIYDNLESHVRSLLSLGVDSMHYGTLLIPVIMEKLPSEPGKCLIDGECYSACVKNTENYTMECNPAVNQTSWTLSDGSCKPLYSLLGCFKDRANNKTLPILLKNFRKPIGSLNWKKMSETVEKCAELAECADYQYFALQYVGECYTDENAAASVNYNRYGKSTNVFNGTDDTGREFTVGLERTNCVYKFD